MSRFARLSAWDDSACLRVNALNRNWLSSFFFGAVSRLGDGWVWYGMMVLLPLVHGQAGFAVTTLLAVNGLACTALYKWLKRSTRRPRPFEVFASLAVTEEPLDPYSFPSGHTLHAVAFTVIICGIFPGYAPVLVPYALLVAASRPILGLHYPSDVLAGAAIGAGAAACSLWVVRATQLIPGT